MTGMSAMLAALGGVFFVFGIISLLAALLFGAWTDLYWIYGNFALGIGLLIAAVIGSYDTIRERARSGESRRIGRYGTSAIAQTAIVLAIIGMLAFLSVRYHHRFDVSVAGVHSLSDQSRKVLAGLERDVEVVAFYPKANQPGIEALLARYEYESPRFRVTYADPNRRPDLVERYGVAPEKLGQGLVRIAIGDESIEITEADEGKITNALVKLTRTGQKKVYFVTGHNERPVEGKGAEGKEGFSRAADALRNENYVVETLVLASKGDVPDDADVVVIAGPTRPLLPQEHDALDRYLARGGAVLAMVDPRAQTDLVERLEAWGVEVGDDAIVDRVQSIFGQAMSPLAAEYADHEITRDMREVTVFPMARSMRPRPGADGASLQPIVKTGRDSWAERDLEALFTRGVAELGDDDLPGPVPLAVAGRPAKTNGAAPADGDETPPAPRLVAFGDTDFAANQAIGAYRNRDLFVNSVNWLLGDVEAISIRPSRSPASRLTLSTKQLSTIRYLSLFVLPEAIAVLGVIAWWSRRHAPGR